MPYKQQGKDLQINLLDNDKETVWSRNNNSPYNYSQKQINFKETKLFLHSIWHYSFCYFHTNAGFSVLCESPCGDVSVEPCLPLTL